MITKEQYDSANKIIDDIRAEERYALAMKIIHEYDDQLYAEEQKKKNAYRTIGEDYANEKKIDCKMYCHHNKGKILYFCKNNVELGNIHFFEDRKIFVNRENKFTDLNEAYKFLFECIDKFLMNANVNETA